MKNQSKQQGKSMQTAQQTATNQQNRGSNPKKKSNRALWLFLGAPVLLLVILMSFFLHLRLSASPAVVKIEGQIISEDMYSYWLSCYKYDFLKSHKHLAIEDTPKGWLKEYKDGQTYADYAYSLITPKIEQRLIGAYLFDQYGFSLTPAEKQQIDAALDDVFLYADKEEKKDDLLAPWGATEASMRKIAVMDMKYNALPHRLYGNDGELIFSPEYVLDVVDFYEANYERFKIIYTEDQTKIDAIDDMFSATDTPFFVDEEDFDTCQTLFSEYETAENYPRGLYLYTKKDYTELLDPEIYNQIGKLNIGQCVKVANDSGMFYVLRLPLEEQAYLLSEEVVGDCFRDFTSLATNTFYHETLVSYLDMVEYTDLSKDINLAYITTNKDYNLLDMLY